MALLDTLSVHLVTARHQSAAASHARILIATADFRRAAGLREILLRRRYAVSIALDPAAVSRQLHSRTVDLLVVELGDPGLDGLAICRSLRAEGLTVAVIMLHAAAGVDELLAGFDAGADAFLRGWYSHAELLAQIDALTRRRA